MELETCGNCGRTIGKLETAHVWKNCVVCGECFTRLSGNAGPKTSSVAATRHRIIIVALLAAIAATLAAGVGAWSWKSYQDATVAKRAAEQQRKAAEQQRKWDIFLDDRKSQEAIITSYFQIRVAGITRDQYLRGSLQSSLNYFTELQNIGDNEIAAMLHSGMPVDDIIKAKTDCSIKNAARVLSGTLDPDPQQLESARRTVGLAPPAPAR